MIRNLLPRMSGLSSAAFSFSALRSGTAKKIVANRSAVCQVLLLALGCALSGVATQAQTANFGGAQTTVVGGLSLPSGIAADGSGNVYIADTGNNRVLKETYSAGSYTQSIIGSGLTAPQGVAVDAVGNVYIADTGNFRVLKEAFASGSYTQSAVTTGTSANSFIAVAVDTSSNVYIADALKNQVLKETFSSGSYTQSTVGGSVLSFPASVAVDTSGNVYIANANVENVLKVPASDLTCATSGDCTTIGSSLNLPQGVAVDASGNVYIADSGNNRIVKETFSAGSYTQSTVVTGLSNPLAVAVDAGGNIFSADNGNNRAQEEQVAGVNLGSSAVGVASSAVALTFNFTNATAANIAAPVALTGGATGKDFAVAGGTCSSSTSYSSGGTSSCTVNVTITPAYPGQRMGAVELTNTSGTIIATAYVYGTGTAPQVAFEPGVQSSLVSGFSAPAGVATDQAGNVYVADSTTAKVFKYSASGTLTATVATGLTKPIGVAVDGAGNVFVADNSAGKLYDYVLSGSTYTKETIATGLSDPEFVAVDGSGNVYVSTSGDHAVHVYAPGSASYTLIKDVANGSTVSGFTPNGVAVDAAGNVYVADAGNSEVSIFTPNGSTYTKGAVAVSLSSPYGVAVDASGKVYVTLSGGTDVLEYTPGGGTAYTQSSVGSGLASPAGVAVDFGGNIYVTNGSGTKANTLQKVDISDPPTLTFASTTVGSVSSDSPQTVTVANIGNEQLTIESNPSIATNFLLDSANTCGVFSSPVAAGASCALALDFKPTEFESPLTGTVVLTDNSLNANITPFATHVIDLSGTTEASSTSTAVTSSVNPSTVNQSVTFMATVTNTASGASTAPTGTVQFKVDGANSGNPVALTLGSTTSTASIQLSNLTISGSPHTIAANYLNSDGAFATTSGTVSGGQTVTAASATLAFTTVPSGAVTTNSTATFSVTLTAANGTSPITPAGTVTFSQGSTTLCTTTLSTSAPYTAACSTKALVGPTNATVTASYSDKNGNFIVSNPVSTVVTLAPLSTTLSLFLTTASPTVDTTVNLTASVGASSITPLFPTGKVSFSANGVPIPECSGANARTLTTPGTSITAQCSTVSLTAPSATITATYTGDNNFSTSNDSLPSFTVNPLTPKFTVASAPVSPATSIVVNAPATFTVNFSTATSPTPPKGNIALTQGSTALCTINLTVSPSCQAPGTALPNAGTLAITATYSNDTQFQSITYTNSSVKVNPGASTVAVSQTGGIAGVDQTATFTATVTSSSSGASTPQGTIAFQVTDPTSKITTRCPNVTLASGSAACPYTFALSGSYTVKATYNPNPANFATGSGSTTVTSVVYQLAPSLGTTNPAAPVVDQAFTLTATVAAAQLQPTAPTGGTITFTSGGKNICSAAAKISYTAASGYQASCTTNLALAGGSQPITATYADSASPANFTATPATKNLQIAPETPTVTISPIATVKVNDALSVTATLTLADSGVLNNSSTIAPTGNVLFYVDGSRTASCSTPLTSTNATPSGANPSYQVTCNLSTASTPVYLHAGSHTFTATYIPDQNSTANFKQSSSASASVSITPEPTTVQINATPKPVYANNPAAYAATLSVNIPTNGIPLSGTFALSNTSGQPITGSAPCPSQTISGATQSTYTLNCMVTYPTNFAASDTVTAAFTTTDGDFTASNSAVTEAVANFGLGFAPKSATKVTITPGYNNTNDIYFSNPPNTTSLASNQIVEVLTTSTGTAPIPSTDTFNYTCTVAYTGPSAPSSYIAPTCSLSTNQTPLGTNIFATLQAGTSASPASAGQYAVTITATDSSTGAANPLSSSQTVSLNIVAISTSTSFSFAGVSPDTQSVTFSTSVSGASLTGFWCPQIQSTSGSMPTGVTTNPFVNQASSTGTATYLTCAASSTTTVQGSTQVSLTVTPLINNTSQKSSSSSMYLAMVFGVPMLGFFGWFGRNKARKGIFRMMALLLLAWGTFTVSGCGGGYTLKTTGSASAPTALPVGTYQVLVAAQDTNNNTYYAVVTVSVI